MEDKNLDANQRIELIQQMIRGTRRRLSFGSSNLFLLWGYLLAATAIVIFVLLKTTDCRAWLWLWLPAAATGGAVTWWHNRFRAPQVKSYTDRLLPLFYRITAFWAGQWTFHWTRSRTAGIGRQPAKKPPEALQGRI